MEPFLHQLVVMFKMWTKYVGYLADELDDVDLQENGENGEFYDNSHLVFSIHEGWS